MLRFSVLMAVLLVVPGLAKAQPEKQNLELRSEFLVVGLAMPESAKPIYSIRFAGQVDKNGEGGGTLELDPNPPKYDEFGFMTIEGSLPVVKLDCTFKIASKRKFMLRESPRVAAPEVEVEWVRLEIQGPKIKSKLFLAHETKSNSYSRLLVNGPDGKVRTALHLHAPGPPEPCHPGCFPAGTPIRTPDGTRPVERIRKGDAVTTIGADGKASATKVASIFVTRNRLLEVRTDAGSLVTTETQPLALADGGLRAAGELKAGDRIWRFDGRERQAVTVKSVLATGREESVYNLVLGDRAIFVADGFLVRSKPPAPAADQP